MNHLIYNVQIKGSKRRLLILTGILICTLQLKWFQSYDKNRYEKSYEVLKVNSSHYDIHTVATKAEMIIWTIAGQFCRSLAKQFELLYRKLYTFSNKAFFQYQNRLPGIFQVAQHYWRSQYTKIARVSIIDV